MDLEQLYDEYVDKVYRFFYIKSLHRHTAEDLTSQTFIAWIESVKINTVDEPVKYLYGIMRNIWISFLKDRYQEGITFIEDIDDFSEFVESSLKEWNQDAPLLNLHKFVEQLPDKQKEVLVLRIIEDRSTKEVMELLQKDANYVKTTLHRAIKNLRSIVGNPYVLERSEYET